MKSVEPRIRNYFIYRIAEKLLSVAKKRLLRRKSSTLWSEAINRPHDSNIFVGIDKKHQSFEHEGELLQAVGCLVMVMIL